MPVLKGQAEVTLSGGRGQGDTRQGEAGHGAWGTLGRNAVAEGSLPGRIGLPLPGVAVSGQQGLELQLRCCSPGHRYNPPGHWWG